MDWQTVEKVVSVDQPVRIRGVYRNLDAESYIILYEDCFEASRVYVVHDSQTNLRDFLRSQTKFKPDDIRINQEAAPGVPIVIRNNEIRVIKREAGGPHNRPTGDYVVERLTLNALSEPSWSFAGAFALDEYGTQAALCRLIEDLARHNEVKRDAA